MKPTLTLPPELAARLSTELDAGAAERLLAHVTECLTPALVFEEEHVGDLPASRGFFDWLRGRPLPPPPALVLRSEASKYDGLPYLEDAAHWPRRADGTPLEFNVQINFAELPPTDALPRQGILSVFSLSSGGDWNAFVWTPAPTGRAAALPADAPRWGLPETRLVPEVRWLVPERLEFASVLGRDLSDHLEGEITTWVTSLNGDPSFVQLLGTFGWRFDEVRADANARARPPRPAAERALPFVHAAPSSYDFTSPAGIAREQLDDWRLLLRIGGTDDDTAMLLLVRQDDLAAGHLECCVPCAYRD